MAYMYRRQFPEVFAPHPIHNKHQNLCNPAYYLPIDTIVVFCTQNPDRTEEGLTAQKYFKNMYNNVNNCISSI